MEDEVHKLRQALGLIILFGILTWFVSLLGNGEVAGIRAAHAQEQEVPSFPATLQLNCFRTEVMEQVIKDSKSIPVFEGITSQGMQFIAYISDLGWVTVVWNDEKGVACLVFGGKNSDEGGVEAEADPINFVLTADEERPTDLETELAAVRFLLVEV